MNEVPQYKIRLAGGEDRQDLYRFHRSLYLDYRREIIPAEFEPLYAYENFERVLRDDVDAIIRDPKCRIWVAEHQKEPFAYLSGRVENQKGRLLPKRGIVEDWFVDAQWRGKGAGKELFRTALAFFKEQRCDVVDSGTWALNEQARRLHRDMGFHEVEVKFRKKL